MPLREALRAGPPLREEDLDRIEAAPGCSLVPEHRAFLRRHNGGVPEPSRIVQSIAEMDGVEVDDFLGLGHAYDIIKANDDERDVLPPGTYAFACHAIGNSFAIKHTGRNAGTVYSVDWEDSSRKPRAYRLAKRFGEFLDRLE